MATIPQWRGVSGYIDPQLLNRKSIGDGIGQIGSALDVFADATRKQNTDAALMQLSQIPTQAALQQQMTGLNANVEGSGRAIDQRSVLDAIAARQASLKTKEEGEGLLGAQQELAKANLLMPDLQPTDIRNMANGKADYLMPFYAQEAASKQSQLAAAQDAADARKRLTLQDIQTVREGERKELETFATLAELASKYPGSVKTEMRIDPTTGQEQPIQVINPGFFDNFNNLRGAPNASGGAQVTAGESIKGAKVTTKVGKPQTELITAMGSGTVNMTAAAKAGFMGNFTQEGGWDGAVGDGGMSHGIAQWNGSRLSNFKNVIGKDPKNSSMAEQWQFVEWELNNPEKAGMTKAQRDAIVSEEDPRKAALLISEYYERPNKKYAKNEARQEHAANYFERMRGQGSTSSSISSDMVDNPFGGSNSSKPSVLEEAAKPVQFGSGEKAFTDTRGTLAKARRTFALAADNLKVSAATKENPQVREAEKLKLDTYIRDNDVRGTKSYQMMNTQKWYSEASPAQQLAAVKAMTAYEKKNGGVFRGLNLKEVEAAGKAEIERMKKSDAMVAQRSRLLALQKVATNNMAQFQSYNNKLTLEDVMGMINKEAYDDYKKILSGNKPK